jgi:hypothetical protein
MSDAETLRQTHRYRTTEGEWQSIEVTRTVVDGIDMHCSTRIAPRELLPVPFGTVRSPSDCATMDAWLRTNPKDQSNFKSMSAVDQMNHVRAELRAAGGMVLPPESATKPEPVLDDMTLLAIDQGYQSNQHGHNDTFKHLPRKHAWIRLKPAEKYRAFHAADVVPPAAEAGPMVADQEMIFPAETMPSGESFPEKVCTGADETLAEMKRRNGVQEPVPTDLVTASDGTQFREEAGDSFGDY